MALAASSALGLVPVRWQESAAMAASSVLWKTQSESEVIVPDIIPLLITIRATPACVTACRAKFMTGVNASARLLHCCDLMCINASSATLSESNCTSSVDVSTSESVTTGPISLIGFPYLPTIPTVLTATIQPSLSTSVLPIAGTTTPTTSPTSPSTTIPTAQTSSASLHVAGDPLLSSTGISIFSSLQSSIGFALSIKPTTPTLQAPITSNVQVAASSTSTQTLTSQMAISQLASRTRLSTAVIISISISVAAFLALLAIFSMVFIRLRNRKKSPSAATPEPPRILPPSFYSVKPPTGITTYHASKDILKGRLQIGDKKSGRTIRIPEITKGLVLKGDAKEFAEWTAKCRTGEGVEETQQRGA